LVRPGRRHDEQRHIRKAEAPIRAQERVIETIKGKERAAELLTKAGSGITEVLGEMALMTGAVHQVIDRIA
jgi:hypothetical protein